MARIFEENQELVKVVVASLAGLVVIAVLIALFVGMAGGQSGSYFDEYAEQEVSTVETGGGYAKPNVDMIGFGLLSDYGLTTDDIVPSVIQETRDFMTLVYPNVSKVSVIKKSIEKSDGAILFRIHANTGEEFSCQLVDHGDSSYALKISDSNNNVILDYDTADFTQPRHPGILAKKYLPYTIRRNDLVIKVTGDGGVLRILVSSCDGKDVDDAGVRSTVDAWLKTKNFDPRDFNFEVLTYCDMEAK